MIYFRLATNKKDYLLIEQLADSIWRQHYTPIIGIDQVNYMLEKFQSVEAIASQIKEGFIYYIIYLKEAPAGYLSIMMEDDILFLSKIYVSKDFRGNSIGKVAITFIESKAKANNLNTIRLTVNKNNNAANFYKKIGFISKGPIVKDIGGGFVMDDYLMEKQI
ncbi:MAG TPA: GNAT family N-acetyltransferase [Flavobacteriaceae bacterium]|nr:GNAT family N-acetyltransferase [Flavobacteriaceae bacterium]